MITVKNAFLMELVSAEMITPHVRHLKFTLSDGGTFDFIPGQFITIHFEFDNKILRRSYSIATIHGKSDYIGFALGYLEGGRASRLLFNLEPKAQLTTTGPFGRLILRHEEKPPKRIVLVATSTGVTPYRAMIPEIEKRLQRRDCYFTVLQGVRSREDLLYSDEFNELQDKYPNFQFIACYSRQFPQKPKDFEHKGYVQDYFEKLSLQSEQDLVYLCGNPGMIDAAVADLQARGFSLQQIRREKYISSN